MSGPKVVRVRTREERIAECLSAIDNLRAAIEQCEQFAEHHDENDADRSRKHTALLSDLEKRANAGSFETVLRTCAQTLTEINFDREELERKVLERASAEATRKQRATLLAQGLAQRLESKGLPIPDSLAVALDLSSTGDIEAAERIISQLLSQQLQAEDQSAPRGVTEVQRKLADALVSDKQTETLVDWAARQTAQASGTPSDRLERLIAEVTRLDTSDPGRQLLARARAVRSESDVALRTRKIDSLLLEWATRRRAITAANGLSIKARRVDLALQRVTNDEAAVLAQRIQSASESAGSALEAAIAQAEAYLVSHARAAVAAQRRNTILSGLASLGYAVSTELITATSTAGRIVVRKPAQPAYGVELMVPEGADRLQMKVVAVTGSTEPRDPSRDREAETTWCSDFSKLQKLMQKSGSDLIIERALGVGAVPLTEVSTTDAEEPSREVADRVRTRTLY